MPLPTDAKAPWPPKAWEPIQRDYREASAWYSGDEAQLISFYGGPAPAEQPGGLGAWWSRFWTRNSQHPHTGRQRLHVPAAADVAATSADLLFGDESRLIVPEAHDAGEGQATGKATEQRLADLAEADGWASTFLEAAEVCAGIGDVYLRPRWDKKLADHPWIDIVHGDHAVPEWTAGRLTAVTFWREIAVDDDVVWRHLERHEPGVILHGLYAGDKDMLGARMPLAALPETRALIGDDGADENGVVRLPEGIVGLLVRHVPNVLPNRRHRGLPVGRSDCAGTEHLMDALDEAMSSWMRDIRLAKARIIVPEEFLEGSGRGKGKSFDVDAEVFSPLDMDPKHMEKAGITLTQFAIRHEEHSQTCMELLQRIVVTAGYSPQTFGMHADGGIKTATEVDANTSRSDRTKGRKRRYWGSAVEDTALHVLILDRALFGSRIEPMRPRIEWGDETETDVREAASALNLLNLANAASTETKVRMLHPDWDQDEIDDEVGKIQAEEGMLAPDPLADPAGNLP